MITLGEKKISKIYLGTTPVKAVYLGEKKVWPSGLEITPSRLGMPWEGGTARISVKSDSPWTAVVTDSISDPSRYVVGKPGGHYYNKSYYSAANEGELEVFAYGYGLPITYPYNHNDYRVRFVSDTGGTAECRLSSAGSLPEMADITIKFSNYMPSPSDKVSFFFYPPYSPDGSSVYTTSSQDLPLSTDTADTVYPGDRRGLVYKIFQGTRVQAIICQLSNVYHGATYRMTANGVNSDPYAATEDDVSVILHVPEDDRFEEIVIGGSVLTIGIECKSKTA